MSVTLFKAARLLLRARVEALPSFSTLFPGGMSWEGGGGRMYTPQPGQAYLRETLKPGQSNTKSMGPTRLMRHNGLYLLDCFSPIENASDGSDDLGDAIQNHFYNGLALPSADVVVKIVRASQSGTLPTGAWRMTPVTIVFYFDTITPA